MMMTNTSSSYEQTSTMTMEDMPKISFVDLASSGHREFDDAAEVIAVMRIQEGTSYKRSDYLNSQDSSLKQVLDGSWRQRIVEWMYGVVDHCSLRRDSVATATYYLDLCVERGLITSREQYQLAAMTALQIAIKLCDSTVVKLQSMVALGRGLFTEQDVILFEAKMLKCLNWLMHPPTPVCFLRQFLRLLPPSISPVTRYMMAEVTRFISEISVCLYKFVRFSPSVIAYAGMLIAMQRFDDISLPISQRNAIYSAMSRGSGMDWSSPQVAEAVKSLQMSLEKNVSLQELMNTIDAQCAEQGYYGKLRGSSSSSSEFDKTQLQQPNGLGACQVGSPRDVIGSH